MLNKNLKLSDKVFSQDVQKIPVRDGFGEGLLLAGEKNNNVVVLTADLKNSTRTTSFSQKFPERFFECGVAEQVMATVASGMANSGKIPFICSFAVFSPGRNWEQIRTTIAINNFPVKIGGLFGGVSVGADGVTHQALEDVALMRVLPNMTILAPADSIEARKAVLKAVEVEGPVYLRIPRVESPIFTTNETPFEIGKANIFWEGRNPQAAIMAYGPIVYEALLVAKQLEESGIETQVINMYSLKPADEEMIISIARKIGAIVTVEDHQIAGGLGSIVSEVTARNQPVPIEFIGVKDQFGQSGKPDELLTKFGLKSQNIIEAVRKVITRKNY